MSDANDVQKSNDPKLSFSAGDIASTKQEGNRSADAIASENSKEIADLAQKIKHQPNNPHAKQA